MLQLRIVFALTMAITLLPIQGSAHSGGTDRYGCHMDSRTGSYHCNHGTGSTSSSSGSSNRC